MREHECIVCGKSLTGGCDTFGPIDAEMCWRCYCREPDNGSVDQGLIRKEQSWETALVLPGLT